MFPEGRFFPDTYRFVRGMTDVELLKKAYDRLDEVLAKEWNKRAADVPYTEPYQALIMASLVEKETGVPQERGQIAGVFVRRMAMGMLLQTDPTVIYGLGERYNGKLTRAHLKEADAVQHLRDCRPAADADCHGRARSDSCGAEPGGGQQPVFRRPWRWQSCVLR